MLPLVALLCLACLVPARADVVRLKNGRSIEGIVREENATHVVIDLGIGSMTLARQSIASIERASDEAEARMRADWEKRNFLHGKYVPQGLEALAASLRGLASRRDEAIAARQSLAAADAREQKLEQQYVGIQNAILASSQKLAATPPGRNIEDYNKRVAENNALQARLALTVSELQKTRDARKGAESALALYSTDLSTYSAAFWPRHQQSLELPEADKNRRFFELSGALLRQFEGEFTAIQVKGTVAGGNTVVPVVVNGKGTGQFIVDTGASMTTLSEALATRLGIDLRDAPTREMTLADGKAVTARIVNLLSLQMGDARLEHVAAAVMPSAPGPNIDGLLGMNFLRHFSFSMHGPSGEITLKRFDPRASP